MVDDDAADDRDVPTQPRLTPSAGAHRREPADGQRRDGGIGRRSPARPRHPRRPDGPVIPAVGDRPARAAASPGAARGGHDGHPPRGADPAARPRGGAAQPPPAAVLAGHRRAARTSPELSRPGAPGALLGEALFLPRVRVVVVAVALPEAELVVVEELEATDPLAALPEVALRDDAGGAGSRARARAARRRTCRPGARRRHRGPTAGRSRCSPARRARRRGWRSVGRRPSRGSSGSRRPPSRCRASSSGSRSGCPCGRSCAAGP